MATQKEKLIKATLMAQRVKNIAKNLRNAADEYGVRLPMSMLNRWKKSQMIS